MRAREIEKEKRGKNRSLKLCFWKIAGLWSKCEDTWNYLEQFDAIGLTETWMKEGTWTKISNKVSKKFKWFCISAERENVRGRAKGGIVIAIKRD